MSILDKLFVFRESHTIKRIIAAFLAIVELMGALLFKLPQTPNGQKIDLSAWQLTWSDEFNGTKLDSEKWQSAGDGPRRGGYWDVNNAIVENGNLYLRTDYQENGRFGPGWYSGSIFTQYLFEKKFGYFECRCKCPGAEGLWGAFWMLARGIENVDGTANDAAEMDIFESQAYAYPIALMHNSVSSTIHYDGYGVDHKSVFLGNYKVQKPYTTFNTYGLEWNEKECVFYINGVETDRVDGKYVSQVAEYLWLSVEVEGYNCVPGAKEDGTIAVGNNGIITANPTDLFPVDMVVDYVRVYDKLG